LQDDELVQGGANDTGYIYIYIYTYIHVYIREDSLGVVITYHVCGAQAKVLEQVVCLLNADDDKQALDGQHHL
jgi:hypothetical protein